MMRFFDSFELKEINEIDRGSLKIAVNSKLENASAEERIKWVLENLPGPFVLSSSFGLYSAVILHLVTSQYSNIPVILVDTGYLFPETYQFIDELTEKLSLNLKVFRAKLSPAWQEARYGKLWTKGFEGLAKYNKLRKVEPMHLAFKKLSAKTWFSGLRRVQSISRANLSVFDFQNHLFKILPIVDWDNKRVVKYLKKNNLKLNPLSKKGYLSIGDVNTTQKWKPGMSEEDTRFFGLKRECGLHEALN